jgi:predicted branched-subunit amino acid permease
VGVPLHARPGPDHRGGAGHHQPDRHQVEARRRVLDPLDEDATLGARARAGLVASLALVPSVFVYGTVFGGLAVQAGLLPLEVWGMSVLVFAGASQFVAVPMIAAGASPLAVVLTTYVVNMRHYLMAATLAPSFGRFRRPWLARSRPPDPGVYIGSAAAVCGAFLAGVVTGTLLGGLVADPERYGLDFAFPAVFLALVAVQLRRRADWLVAVAAAVLAVAIAILVPGNWHIVIAGLTVSAAGALLLPVEDTT